MADVKIPESLFDLLCKILIYEEGTEEDLHQAVRQLSEKQRQRERRKFYRIMQDESNPADVRQYAKEMYQKLSDIHPDWRY